MAYSNRQSRNQQAAVARRAARKRAERKRNLIAAAVIVAVMALLGGTLIGALGNDDDETATSSTSSTTPEPAGPTPTAAPAQGRTISGTTPCPPASGPVERATKFNQAPPVCIDAAKTYTATFDTSLGKVVVALNDERSPIAVNNFVVLGRYGYYDGTAIFRTDPGLDIIQGGSPNTQSNSDSPGYSIQDGAGKFTYQEGELIMARTSAPNSGGSQFFFSTGPKVSVLDDQGTYVTLGKVTEGLDVLKAIIGKHVDTGGALGGAPSELVVINDLTITEA